MDDVCVATEDAYGLLKKREGVSDDCACNQPTTLLLSKN